MISVLLIDLFWLFFQAPAALRMGSAVLGESGTLQLLAGGIVPAVDVNVENGAGRGIVKALLGGKQQALEVTQRLWRMRAAADGPAAGSRRGKCARGKKFCKLAPAAHALIHFALQTDLRNGVSTQCTHACWFACDRDAGPKVAVALDHC